MTAIVILLLLSVLTNAAFQLSLKRGILGLRGSGFRGFRDGRSIFCVLSNPFILFAAALLLPSMLLWLKALSMTDLSFAYPFQSLTLVLISLGSMVFLKERVATRQWAGIALIVLGIFCISYS